MSGGKAPQGEGFLSAPWRSTTVQVVLWSTFLAPFTVALVSPALPVFRDAFGLTDSQASLLLVAALLPGVFLSPVLGFLVDRVGRRRVLVTSLFVWSLGGGLIAVGLPFAVVLGLRVVQGAAMTGIGIATVTLIGDVFEEAQRNRIFGLNVAVLSAGAAVFPLVGGALAAVSWNAPFVMYLFGLPVALFAYRVLEEPVVEREPRSVTYLQRVVSALSAREATVLYGAALLIDLLLFGTVFTALPFLLADAFALSPLLIGLVVTTGEVASTVAATQNGRLARSRSDGDIVALGFLATGAGLLGAWVAPTPLLLAVATLGFGAGWGVALPSIDAAISDLVPAQFRAGALSLRNTASSLGRSLGPLLFAAFGARGGYRPLLVVAGGVALAFAVVVRVLTE